MKRRNFTLMWTALLLAAVFSTSLARAEDQKLGVDVGKTSAFTKLAPAEDVEKLALTQYQQQLDEARKKNALASNDDPQLQRLRVIADQIIPHALSWNPRAKNWKWEINLIVSKQVNAYCMPGGKIAFYTGILEQLKLTDDEVAMVMGHEIAHALREHARERMGKSQVTNGLARVGGVVVSALWGIDPNLTDSVARGGANLLTLSFSRDDESEADLVGMELAARAGYDPRAGVTLWRKMSSASKGAPPQWMSTHPSGKTRIKEIEKNLPRVEPLYEQAKK
ncbi:M48 family peptidase [Hylemonella gracilis]|uniref:M48 family peptidase n=1 Tax=Hylemonella gracilis TaxID=80880 RepID=A0A4P6UGA7_9BURK|nr:M48 family metallopeptidase [Hylemonella gracilis]QBK03873.1 M48 family peptidase [Hylemonella gracilis]